VNTEGWRRRAYRDAFAQVPENIAKPNLPRSGMLVQSYNPVEEAAHQVGRVLHAIDDPDVTDTIVADVKEELNAVEQAELGDLAGRARQAVVLTRAGASPAQVHAADRLFHDHPLGTDALFTDLDPAAASVAAAHWLQAAADVTADESGLASTQIVIEADNIEALPHNTPTIMLELLESGRTPYEAVTGLIKDAMAAAEGRIPNIEQIPAKIKETEDNVERYGSADPQRLRAEFLYGIRSTPLDPQRPARDLLEDLLYGIRGCWLIYQEYAYSSVTLDEDAGEFADPAEDDVDNDEYELIMASFTEAVRAEAAENRERLQ
jgi:hypothetical protein